MIVIVNGKAVNIHEESNLLMLLEQLALSDIRGQAVAVNETVIQKDNWATYQLNENDEILIIKATQGG